MGVEVTITVYGADQICASCVGAPSSKDTYEWLQAAIGRKYVDDSIRYKYIDINHPPEEEKHQDFVQQIVDEDLFWPIVFVNEDLVAEGIPRLKTIYEALNKRNITLRETETRE